MVTVVVLTSFPVRLVPVFSEGALAETVSLLA